MTTLRSTEEQWHKGGPSRFAFEMARGPKAVGGHPRGPISLFPQWVRRSIRKGCLAAVFST